MVLADQYAFGGKDHFDPEEVMKVPQILHVERCRKLELYAVDFTYVGTGDDQVINIYSKILTGLSRPFRMNSEESDFDLAKPIQRSCCVIFAF